MRQPTLLLLSSLAVSSLSLPPSVLAAQAEEAPTNGWRISAGAALISTPKYPGSDTQKTRVSPIVSASHGRFFVGPVPASGSFGLGLTLYDTDGLRFGVAASSDLRELRKESDDPRLAGLGDIGRTQRAHVFASYGLGRYTVRTGLTRDVGGRGLGTLATLEAEGLFNPAAGWFLSAGPSITWADRRYTQTVFGINAAQSTASGRALYEPGAGVNMLSLGATLIRQLDARWSVGARLSLGRLQGDAADSPISVQKSQTSGTLFTSYQF